MKYVFFGTSYWWRRHCNFLLRPRGICTRLRGLLFSITHFSHPNGCVTIVLTNVFVTVLVTVILVVYIVQLFIMIARNW